MSTFHSSSVDNVPEKAASEQASETQIELIGRYIECDGVSEEDWKAELQRRFGKPSLEELTKWQAAMLLLEMQQREGFQKQDEAATKLRDKAK